MLLHDVLSKSQHTRKRLAEVLKKESWNQFQLSIYRVVTIKLILL